MMALASCTPKTFEDFRKGIKKEFGVTLQAPVGDNTCATAQLRVLYDDYSDLKSAERKTVREELSAHKNWVFSSPLTARTLKGETLILSSSFEHCSDEIVCQLDCTPNEIGIPVCNSNTNCELKNKCETVDFGTNELIHDVKVMGPQPVNKVEITDSLYKIVPEQLENQVRARSAFTSDTALYTSIKDLKDYLAALAMGKLSETVDAKTSISCGSLLPLKVFLNPELAKGYITEMERIASLFGDKDIPMGIFSERTVYGSIDSALSSIAKAYAENDLPEFNKGQVLKNLKVNKSVNYRSVALAIALTR